MSIFLILFIVIWIYFAIRQFILSYRLRKIPVFVTSTFGDGLSNLLVLSRFTWGIDAIQELGYQMFEGTAVQFKNKMCLLWMGFLPHIAISSAEDAEPVLSSNEVIRKSIQYNFLHSWIGTGLLTSWGDKWRYNRKLLTPAFHFKILEQFVPVMSRNAKILTKKLEAESEENNGIIQDLRQTVLLCTLDVICETAMGKRIDAQSDPEAKYVKAVHEVGDIVMDRVWKPWSYFESIFNLMPLGKKNKSLLKTIHSFTDSVIVSRKEQVRAKLLQSSISTDPTSLSDPESEESLHKRREPFMDTLIREHFSRPDNFTDLNIREEVDTFMFEGHDTTGWGVIWTTFLLGLHPQIQERVQDEVDSVFEGGDPDRELTLEELKLNLPYTEAVVKEAQRLYPSVPVYNRVTEREIMVAGYKIPAGVTLLINVIGIHKDPKHWPEPQKFIPERFLGNTKRHPYAYIPFSAGPRNCIGQKFALLEEKALIAKIFRKFQVTSLDSRDKVLPTLSLILKTESPIRVRMEPRIL